MKRFLLVLALTLFSGNLYAATAATNDVPYALLKMTPEKYKSKLFSFTEVYREVLTTLPFYMDGSTFKGARWAVVYIGDPNLPVLIKKKPEVITMLTELKAGCMVRVYGRVREFKPDSRFVGVPSHYVEAESIIDLTTQKANPREGMVRPPAGRELAPPPF
jgi:hypothetical protein